MTKKLYIFGCGEHALKVYHFAVAKYASISFVYETPEDSPVAGVSASSLERVHREPADKIFVAIGNPIARRRIVELCVAEGWELATIIHETAYCAPGVDIGEGSVICAGAIIETGSVVGRCAIVDIGALLDHGTRVADYVHIKPGQICPANSNISG